MPYPQPDLPDAAAPTPPRCILLATDLSCRSDRALDRALRLARDWNARLIAVTVIAAHEPHHSRLGLPSSAKGPTRDDAQRTAERRLRADTAGSGVPVEVRVEHGDPTERILAVAQAEHCDLIILGVARNEALSRIVLGSTVDALAGRSPVPLLVVRQRARAAYPRLVIASDFSPAAAHALREATRLFPQASLRVFHAYATPYPMLTGISSTKARDDGLLMARQQAEAHLADPQLPPGLRDHVHLKLQHGDPGLLLEAHGQDHCDDLLVLGTKRRHRLLSLLIGSVGQRILERAESDVLVIGEAAQN